MKLRYFAGIAAVALLAACDSPLDIDPTGSIPATGYTNAREIAAGVNGAYSTLKASALYSRELTTYPELYADNLDFTGTYGTDRQVWNRNVFPTNGAFLDAWRASYRGLNRVNTVLAGLDKVDDLSAKQEEQFRGEMYFLRALNHLNLVRYFGGVPIATKQTDEISDDLDVSRNTQAEVYAQIEEDLLNAIDLLDGKNPPVGHATEGAAKALLVRVYLEQGGQERWEAARDLATDVIDNGGYELVKDYKDIFVFKNGTESILEIQYSTIDSNAQAYWYFPGGSFGGRRGYAPTKSLYDAHEANDVRRDVSIGINPANGQRYGKKYFRVSGGDDNVIVLRLAEMYLARAEANAYLNEDPAVVRADIDVIRDRAGLDPLENTITTQDDLISAVLQERRIEFAMEGHRFFDLRRNGRAEAVLGIAAHRLLFPIPQGERDVNSNLDQNPGYN
jgi:hypothetical protein